ncbi:MAG: hypothetical protein M1831_002452 [Alyxoria varia]|nr:MAG: hypothetical protein M1831_002452 [Alyxoria varia]
MAAKPEGERIERGDYSRSPVGTATFVGLRLIDPFLQYGVLSPSFNLGAGLITALGGATITQSSLSSTGIGFLDRLDLSPYRLALLGMATASSVKHAAWALFINNERVNPQFATMVGLFNSTFNSVNSLLFICALTSAAKNRSEGPGREGWPGAPLVVGGTLFATGILTELISEIQRKIFKNNPNNKGKPYTGGLFGFARHINYTGYTLWRAGYALASTGWAGGLAVGTFFFYDFATRSIPMLNEYCENRYADMWHDYQKEVPYKLVPYVY